MNNFHQVLNGINVHPLLEQIAKNPQLWEVDKVWTSNKPTDAVIRGVENVVLRYNASTPPGQEQNWDKPAFHILDAAQPIIWDLMRALPGEHLGKVLITRLPPGEQIAPHTHTVMDRAGRALPQWPHYYRRYQIPLYVQPGCVFVCGDEEIYMEPGTAWTFRDTDPVMKHAVYNNSDEPRISMFADIRPFKKADHP